jgi:hypothetical protein
MGMTRFRGRIKQGVKEVFATFGPCAAFSNRVLNFGGPIQADVVHEEACDRFAGVLLMPCTPLEFRAVMAGQRPLQGGEQNSIAEVFAWTYYELEELLDDLHHRRGIAVL